MYGKPITNHISQKGHVNGANSFDVTVLHIGCNWANKITLLKQLDISNLICYF